MPRTVVIAIDDTDMPDTRGTGRLARMLADELEMANLGTVTGVTRHQFHVGPGVPMTSHNSAAAIAMETERSLDELETFAKGIMSREFIPGSDPGLALLDARAPGAVIAFARRAQQELVQLNEAEGLVRANGLRVLGLGGTRDGMIGAMSAAALRWEGNDGRYVGLPGLRDLLGRMTVSAMLAGAPIDSIIDEESCQPLEPTAILDTGDWVRPRLMDGRPIVVARKTDEPGVWANADHRTHED